MNQLGVLVDIYLEEIAETNEHDVPEDCDPIIPETADFAVLLWANMFEDGDAVENRYGFGADKIEQFIERGAWF
jgi:hypothetical protein